MNPIERRYPLYFALGLCPMLGVVHDHRAALSMGLVFFVTVLLTGGVISVISDLIPRHLRLPIIIIVSATVVSLISLGLQYFIYAIYDQLGIWLSLLAMNCLVIAIAEEEALCGGVIKTIRNAIIAGIAVVLLLLIIGLVRYMTGSELLNGPAGAFLLLGLCLAAINQLISMKENLQKTVR